MHREVIVDIRQQPSIIAHGETSLADNVQSWKSMVILLEQQLYSGRFLGE
jgi:hypothetical protein